MQQRTGPHLSLSWHQMFGAGKLAIIQLISHPLFFSVLHFRFSKTLIHFFFLLIHWAHMHTQTQGNISFGEFCSFPLDLHLFFPFFFISVVFLLFNLNAFIPMYLIPVYLIFIYSVSFGSNAITSMNLTRFPLAPLKGISFLHYSYSRINS